MASGKASPRQKMINMMYLVLTALLALNVSKEILEAFVVVNEGMLLQKTNIEKNNGRIYGDFEQQKILYKENFERIKPFYENAQLLRKISDELVNEIEVMKAELIATAEQITKEKALEDGMTAKDLTKLEDYDIPTYYFGTDDPAKPARGEGKAAELKKKIADYREKLLSKQFFDKISDTSKVQLNLSTEDPISFKTKQKEPWEMFYFYHLPMPAALTELTKWQNNVRAAEGAILSYLYDKISASSYKFDAIKAAIIPKSNVVFAGNAFEADIFLAAYNTSERPTILVNGSPVTEFSEDGRGLFKVQASGEGEKTVTGVIKIKDPITGGEREEPFETKYQVSKPMMTVTPDQMNVFYRGLDNPITVSVPGVAPNQITATCSGCNSFTGGNGKYIVKPGSGNEANISVSVKLTDGKVQNMGAAKFRVKRIPDPQIKFGSKSTGEVITVPEAQNSALIPLMQDFDFNVFAQIKSFAISYELNGSIQDKQVSGNKIPSDVATNIARMQKGKKIYFDKIMIGMPDGTTRTQSAVFTIR
ncbi:MAG: gliding motility protein GldM [Flavobacteriales bacterium]|nr:gliding motility protein GldM [Flavobacteriales bacterium]